MQKVTIICVGKLKEKFYADAVSEYVKRLSRFCKLEILELAEERLPDDPSQAQIDAALQKESDAIRAKLPAGAHVIAMCVEGKERSSEELARLMEAMAADPREHSYETNLRSLGYADLADPAGISIYFIDFASKEHFINFLDTYNENMESSGNEDKYIRYADITGIMMSSVRTIIDSVSYALIAFVAVSLVVSSI